MSTHETHGFLAVLVMCHLSGTAACGTAPSSGRAGAAPPASIAEAAEMGEAQSAATETGSPAMAGAPPGATAAPSPASVGAIPSPRPSPDPGSSAPNPRPFGVYGALPPNGSAGPPPARPSRGGAHDPHPPEIPLVGIVPVESLPRAAPAPALASAALALAQGRLAAASREASRLAAERNAAVDLRMAARAISAEAMRRGRQLAAAQREFDEILRLWADGGPILAELARIEPDESRRRVRTSHVLDAVGEALFHEAEQARDAAEAIAFPTYRGDRSRADVQQYVATKVKAWAERKHEAIQRAEAAYVEIAKLSPAAPPTWMIAAASRTGALWAAHARDLRSVVVPKEFESPGNVPGGKVPWSEVHAQYRGALVDATQPMVEKARAALEVCVRQAEAHQIQNAFVESCANWLALDPH